MEVPSEQSSEGKTSENPQISARKKPLEGSRSAAAKTVNPGGSVATRKRVAEPRTGSGSVSGSGTSIAVAKRSGSTTGSVSSVSAPRRNSTGGLLQKQPVSDGRRKTGADSAVGVKSNASSVTAPVRRSLPELRRSSLPSSPRSGITGKPASASSVGPSSRTPVASGVSKLETAKRPLSKPALTASTSSSRRVASSSLDSSGGSVRRSVSKVSSPLSARSPSVSSGLRARSLSSSSQDRSSALSGRRKGGTPDSRDSRFVVLPQVEIKASDDVVSFVFSNIFNWIWILSFCSLVILSIL